MDKASFFILNVFLNSLLVFITVVLLIEGIIFLFRVPQGRVAAVLRMIPILKLPVDLCLYDFSRWSFGQGINPLNCEEGTRTLSLMFGSMSYVTDWLYLPINSTIQLTIPGDLTFTIADMIGYGCNPFHLKVFVVFLLFLTTVFFVRKLFICYRALNTLRFIANESQSLNRKIHNSAISSYIKNGKIEIQTSQKLTGSPFVAGLTSSVIYIPRSLSDKLTRKEYEAVLAHEIGHVRYKDSFVRLTLDFICTVYWWIPTKWLRNHIEEGQEVGCDLKCKSYGIDLTTLASAVCKSAKFSINTPKHIFAHHLAKNTIFKRVTLLLNPPFTKYKKTRLFFTCLAAGIAFLMIFLGRFWVF